MDDAVTVPRKGGARAAGGLENAAALGQVGALGVGSEVCVAQVINFEAALMRGAFANGPARLI